MGEKVGGWGDEARRARWGKMYKLKKGWGVCGDIAEGRKGREVCNSHT